MPFTGGPSVRVSPNVKFEIRYIADFGGDGTAEIFDNAAGDPAGDRHEGDRRLGE